MIANLTQHAASQEQLADGVVDLGRASLTAMLTFDDLPTRVLIEQRARCIAKLAQEANATHAMIGGAPYLMAQLEIELRRLGIKPLYAFSRRESMEQVQSDGSTRKVAVFRHAASIEA